MLDRVDRAGELLDRPGERTDEIIDQRRRGTDLAGLLRVLLDRTLGPDVTQQAVQPSCGRGFEMSVVQPRTQPVLEAFDRVSQLGTEARHDVVAGQLLSDEVFDRFTRLGNGWADASIASAASYPNRWPTIAESTKPRAASTGGTLIVAAAW